MKKKMGIEGVGPKIIAFGIIYAVIAYFVSRNNLEYFRFAEDLSNINWLIYLLAAIGIIFWLGSAIQLFCSWNKKNLITNGFFAIFLNPLYVAFILFIFPALSLFLNNWLYLGLSVVFLIAMELLIKDEYRYLKETFGKDYEEYKKKVLIKL